ncbi:MAG: ComF family protein [Gammaproteobacteria bacterium]
MDQLILAMKQQPRPDLLTSFARWMSDHLADSRVAKPDLLLPVPMHPAKQRQRGFNQAAVLAHRVGKQLKIPVRHDLLSKRTSTEEQKTLSREQRQRNLANAFKLERVKLLQMRPRPRHIALVDDVITTGTTTAQLAALLKKSGIARVDVWALAKTPLQNPG